MERAIRVLLTDDQVLYREGLRALIAHWQEFEVIGEAANGKEAVAFCKENDVDLVLMDVRMPEMDGVTAASIIRQQKPDIAIVMLTVESDDAHVFDSLGNSVNGYVLKDMPSRRLRDSLNGVFKGEAVLSGAVAKKVIREFSNRGFSSEPSSDGGESAVKAKDFGLTEAEMEILVLVVGGLSNEEIGAKLYMGVGTVKRKISAIMKKLNVENRVMLATYAIRVGLVD